MAISSTFPISATDRSGESIDRRSIDDDMAAVEEDRFLVLSSSESTTWTLKYIQQRENLFGISTIDDDAVVLLGWNCNRRSIIYEKHVNASSLPGIRDFDEGKSRRRGSG